MACEAWIGKLDLYLDGELETAEAAAVSVHLRSCRACASEALERVQLKRAVQAAGRRYQPSAQLRSKIALNVAPKQRSAGFAWWKWAAIPALVLAIAAVALYASLERDKAEQRHVYSELADLHVATLASGAPVDVLSSDRHTVKPWFQGKIPFTFNLPELQGSEFSLVGGRVAFLEQSATAHLIYQLRQHKISVFIVPDRSMEVPDLPQGPVNRLSFNIETWKRSGLQYFVIGDASADDIRALSKLLRSAR